MFVESIQTNIGWLATKQELARKICASLQSTKVNQGPGAMLRSQRKRRYLVNWRTVGDFMTRNQPGTQRIKIQVSVVGVRRATVGGDD